MAKWTKPRFFIVYPLALWLFLAARTTERALLIGMALVVLGEGIRLWANGYVGHVKVNAKGTAPQDSTTGRLVTAGPYAFIRHPLYFGSLLIGAGFCVIVGNPWFAGIGLALFLLVYRRKIGEEEALLEDQCGRPYQAYRAAVPRWWPTWRRYAHRQGQWAWQGIVASKEWKTLIWVTVMIIALYFREELVQEGEALFSSRAMKHLILLGVMVALMAGDGISELLIRRAKHRRVARPLATS